VSREAASQVAVKHEPRTPVVYHIPVCPFSQRVGYSAVWSIIAQARSSWLVTAKASAPSRAIAP
jgi:hypothetical protein